MSQGICELTTCMPLGTIKNRIFENNYVNLFFSGFFLEGY